MKRENKGAQPATSGQPPVEFVKTRFPATENPEPPTVTDTGIQCLETVSSGQNRVREAAKRDKDFRFTNLLRHITVEQLHAAHQVLNPKTANGVDEVTWLEYGKGLEERLAALHGQIQNGTFRVRPSRQIWLPDGDGKTPPLGIDSLEVKIIQQALEQVLQHLYVTSKIGLRAIF